MNRVRGFVLLAGCLAVVPLAAHRSTVSAPPSSATALPTAAARPAPAPPSALPADPLYQQVAKLGTTHGGKPLGSFSFDEEGRRLWASSMNGLYWVNVDEAKPVWKGPVLKMLLTQAEFAKGLNRVYFSTPDEVGFVNVDTPSEPHIIAKMQSHGLVYEETRKEIYVASRHPTLEVFDAASGERAASIKLPGWEASFMRAVPGRVFLTLANKQGIFVIDGATHTLKDFPIDGKLTTPAYIEADRHQGRYLFFTYDRTLVAVDASNGHVLGRRNFPFTPSIAFDEGTDLLVATFDHDPPPVRLVLLKVGPNGFEKAGTMSNPAIGASGVIPLRNGFLQRGHLDFLLWKTTGN